MAIHEVKLSAAQILWIGITLGFVVGVPSGIASFLYGWNSGGSGKHAEVEPAIAPLPSGITGFSGGQVREYAGRLMWIADIKSSCEKSGYGPVEIKTFEDADFYTRVCTPPLTPPPPPNL